MLKILHNIGDLDLSQFYRVYRETVAKNAALVGLRLAEKEIYDDLSIFLDARDAVCCLWRVEGRYVCCVRREAYRDGFLLTCLETAPEERRKGYASLLLSAVIAREKEVGRVPAYVHVHKHNKASIALHTELGFRVIADVARLVDGTVSTSFYTMKYE